MRHEYPYNTSEQVRDYLTEALLIVDELDPPEDLRGLVFAKAAELVSGKQIVFEQPAMLPDLARH
jgi:hypothetical protein